MPLPTALQARLHKRGLIRDDEISKNKDRLLATKVCPNAWNPYHTCGKYCEEHLDGIPDEEQAINQKIISANPLPPGWFLVPDPDKGCRSYYWNVNTNLVSWLHPQDPKAEITYSVSAQSNKSSLQGIQQNNDKMEEVSRNNITLDGKANDHKKMQPKIKTGKHPSLLKAQREKERSNPYLKKQSKKEEVDPMDPAAYSDVPRGNWSSGLREDGEVKTGVDTTANGPLFQQRPYPSPGDVLRRNKNQSKN